MEGTVKFFNRMKGYGFISGDDGKDYFAHFSAVKPGVFLRDNDKVSFDPAEGDRGLKAENIELLQKASERDDLETEGGEEAPAEESTEEQPEEEAPAEEPTEEPAEEKKEE